MTTILDNIIELIIGAITSTIGAVALAIIYKVAEMPEIPMDPRFRIMLGNVVTMYNVANEIDSTAIELALAIVSTIIATITIFLLLINGRSHE